MSFVRDGKVYAAYLKPYRMEGDENMGREEEEVEEEDGGRSNDMERLARKRQSILQKLETFSDDSDGEEMSDREMGSPARNGGCPFKRHKATSKADEPQTNTFLMEEDLKEEPAAEGDAFTNPSSTEETTQFMDQEAIENELEKNVEQPLWKTVLERMENDHFEALPSGWQRVTHNSGLPVYLHRESRVITLSRPYFLGPDSARHHNIPISAVPCLQQKRLKENEAAQQQVKEEPVHENAYIKGIQAAGVKIERFEDSRITATDLTNYASSLFKFKKIQVKRYTSFKDKKLERQKQKTEKMLREAGVTAADVNPEETATVTGSGIALINIPSQDNRFHKKTFVMNPRGRSSVAILHEYVQRSLKGRIVYDIHETLNPTMTYTATAKLYLKKQVRLQLLTSIKEKVEILQNEKGPEDEEEQFVLGSGQGTSKKNAKLVAAEKAVNMLLPEVLFDQDHMGALEANGQVNYDAKATEVFDKMEITDKRVVTYCERALVAKPYHCLKEACQRNVELQGREPQCKHESINDRETRLTMTIGPYSATVTACGNKQAREYAAQQILKQMHPGVTHYGNILRKYANAQEKHSRKENIRHHEEVISLQNKGPHTQPNRAIINKLREEMHKIVKCPLARPSLMYSRSPESGPFPPLPL